MTYQTLQSLYGQILSKCLCWVFISHVWISDSYQDAVLQKQRSQLWKAPALRHCVVVVPPACPRQCLWPLLSRGKGTATGTRALPYLYFNHVSRVYQSHLKTKPSIYIGKWSPTWEPVLRTWGSPPVQVTGYEVIIILYKLMFAKAGNTLQRLEILCKRWPLEALGRSSNRISLV